MIIMSDDKKCKIVVFGAFGAGKTTLIKTLDPESSHVEANCAGGTTTIALDYGRVQVNENRIHIFGTPGRSGSSLRVKLLEEEWMGQSLS